MKQRKECPICEHTDFMPVTNEGDRFDGELVSLCRHCGVLFLEKYAIEDNYYLDDEFSGDFRGSAYPTEKQIAINNDLGMSRWISIRKEMPEGGTLLEIGCGSGGFLRAVGDTYKLYAMDPSTGYAEYARESTGANVVTGFFPEDLDKFEEPIPEEGFDAVAIIHTLEHTEFPVDILMNIWSVTKPGGRLYVEVPDAFRAMAVRGTRFHHKTYFQKSHLIDFDYYTLSAALRASGFSPRILVSGMPFPRDKNIGIIAEKTDSIPENFDFKTSVLDERIRALRATIPLWNQPEQS